MLPKLEGYAAALLESLPDGDLTTVATEMTSLEQTILARADLRAVLTDTSIAGVARGAIVRDLLAGKLHETSLRLAVFAATAAPAQEVPRAIDEVAQAARVLEATQDLPLAGLGLMEARRRVAGFADALLDQIDTVEFAVVEEELFRWARTVEANADLRRLLLDRDAPLASRLGTVEELLGGRVSAISLRLAKFVIEGGRPRDVVGTLDYLVDYVARSRDWRVARVYTARDLDASSQADLVNSLATLTGKSVELQIAQDPALVGGVLVEVGDLRLDATTRGRLGALHDAVASGHFYESTLNGNE